jgi:hypothetical protein
LVTLLASCILERMDARRQHAVLSVALVAAALCGVASLQLSRFWPLATAGWLTALACAGAVARRGSGWRRGAGIALLVAALLAVLSFVAFVGFYFVALRDL